MTHKFYFNLVDIFNLMVSNFRPAVYYQILRNGAIDSITDMTFIL